MTSASPRALETWAARKAKAAHGAPAMTFSSLRDQDHIMIIILRPAGINRHHPAGPSPCQYEPSSLHLRSDIGLVGT